MNRALGGALVLAAEYLALGLLFDGTALAARNVWWAAFGQVGALVSIGVAVLTAGLLLRGRELLERLKESTAGLRSLEIRWALVHGALYAGFVATTNEVFGAGAKSSAFMSATMVGWLTLGLLSFLTLFRLTFGVAWRPIAKAVLGLVAAGLALGLLGWFVGVRSVTLWPWLAGATLRTSAWMLAPFAENVRVVPEEALLGIDEFEVTIGAPCSGLEGLGAVLVFLVGYLFVFRERFRFPQSLLLIPLALVAVWVANALRIAALLLVGAHFSPEIALGGFHSKAGWLGLCLVALGVVALTRNNPRFAREASDVPLTESPTAAFLLPLLTFAGVGLVTGLFTSGPDWLYPLRVVAAGAVALHYRKEYPKPASGFPWWGLAMGAVAFVAWVFLARDAGATGFAGQAGRAVDGGAWLRGTWLLFRVVGAVAVVPVIEELAFRGFLQRRLIAEDFTAVPQARFTWPSLVVSALAFGLLHESWVASVVAGALYSLACYRRGRLEEAVVAHAVTNALLVFGSLVLGYRELWQ